MGVQTDDKVGTSKERVNMDSYNFTRFVLTFNKILPQIYIIIPPLKGTQWLSGRVLDSRPRVRASPASLFCVLVQEH